MCTKDCSDSFCLRDSGLFGEETEIDGMINSSARAYFLSFGPTFGDRLS